MQYLTLLVAGAAYVATVLGQANIAFTSVPAEVVAGQQYTITWAGGDGTTPVTITLRKGDPQNLQTVSTLTSSGTNGNFVWTADSSLPSATDYALQITQGQSDINYSGPFALSGGTGSASISYSGSSNLLHTSSLLPTSSLLHTSTLLPTSTLVPAPINSTITSISSAVSTGTTLSISRNTTLSSQTLTTTSRTTSSSTTPSTTPSDPSATSPPSSNGATQLTSSLVLLLGLVAAVVSYS